MNENNSLYILKIVYININTLLTLLCVNTDIVCLQIDGDLQVMCTIYTYM